MYAVLTYGFPLILIFFEFGFRSLLGINTSGFVGPTLAATGLSFLVPLTKPQQILSHEENSKGHIITNKTDTTVFIPLAWIVIFIFILLWLYTCHCSITEPTALLLGYDKHLVVGSFVYACSLVLIAIKSVIND